MCGLDDVPELIEAGVSCFKIEGRLKDERYVAATTRAYREAIDAVWDHHATEDTVSRNDLRQVFARGQDSERDGLTPGFLRGPKHQSLVVGNAPRHRGVLAGRVVEVYPKKSGLELVVEPSAAIESKPTWKSNFGRPAPSTHNLTHWLMSTQAEAGRRRRH